MKGLKSHRRLGRLKASSGTTMLDKQAKECFVHPRTFVICAATNLVFTDFGDMGSSITILGTSNFFRVPQSFAPTPRPCGLLVSCGLAVFLLESRLPSPIQFCLRDLEILP